MIAWAPVDSVLVLSDAVPPESVARPSETAPSNNSTVPVAVPAAGGSTATVTSNVADCPCTDGFGVLVTVVVVVPGFTTCE